VGSLALATLPTAQARAGRSPEEGELMAGRRRLRDGLERVLPNHNTALGKALRRHYAALLSGLEIGSNALLRQEAGRVALLQLRATEAARAWAELVERRRVGKGRRPSTREVERAAKRAALDDETAVRALDRLRELAGRRKPDLARAIQEAQQREG
jgi:hypothetical protein